MSTSYVRWLGAFRKEGSLHDSLSWEFANAKTSGREVAAEPVWNQRPNVSASIGLLADKRCARRTFVSDVWSETTKSGRCLAPTRVAVHKASSHEEAFLRNVRYTAIIVKGRVTKKALKTIHWWAKKLDLPVEHWRVKK